MKERWFKPGTHIGWDKHDSAEKRRRIALKHRHGNLLKTARALQALSNVTKDPGTKKKAGADARHFYALYAKKRR